MRCEAWRGICEKPHKYIVEFSKEEVENLVKNWEFISTRGFGYDVFDVLVEEYKKYNKDSK